MSKRKRSARDGPAAEAAPAPPARAAQSDGRPPRRSRALVIGTFAGLSAAITAFALLLGGPRELPHDPGANVLLITLDTTRADRIGAYGYQAALTPNLDALAVDGVRFAQAYSSVPLTLPAHTSLMTALNPPRHGVRDNGGFFLDDRFETLAERLHTAGRGTFAAVGAFVLHDLWGLSQGFDVYDDDFGGAVDTKSHEMLRVQRDGAQVVERTLAWLGQKRDRPFFVWMHFYDPHHPYAPPPEYAAKFPGSPYDGEIAYTDHQVGHVLEYLRKEGLYDKTLIVVIGDHGEGLGDHREPDHGVFLYDSTLRVPFIVRAPDPAYRGVVDDVVREVDVMPTVLAYLGLPAPDGVEGVSLLGLMAGREEHEPRRAYSETLYSRLHYGWADLAALRESRYKFIEAPNPELYDLLEDPHEQHNLYAERPDVAGPMRERLAELRKPAADAADAAMEDLDPDTLARLSSLGYVGSRAPESGGELPDPKLKLEEMNLLIHAARETSGMLDSGRFAEAAAMLEEVRRREPNYIDGYLTLAAACRGLGEHARAIEVLKRALDKTPDNTLVLQSLGRAHFDHGDLGEAEALFRAIIARSPRYPQAYYGLSEALVAQRRFDDAAATLEQLLAQHPHTAMTQYEIGMVYLHAERLDEAERWIRSSLDTAPRLRNAHYNLALIAEQRGQPAVAREQYEREVELFPDNGEAGVNLGLLCAGAGNLDCAERAFSGVIEHDPDLAVAHYLLARTYLERGRVDREVLAMARRAVELDPSFTRARQLAQQIERVLARGPRS
jgi:arylsulfatase A-like enzyme/Tfp pilus assembly protein PilF